MVDFAALLERSRAHKRGEHSNAPDTNCFQCQQATEEAAERAALQLDHPQFQYVAGPAGCGKTFLMKERVQQGRGRYALCATTGIAAINVGGSTVNSMLSFFDYDGARNSLKEAYDKGWLHGRLRRWAEQGKKRWIIDEVSMMDGRQLDLITKAMMEVNESSFYAHAPGDQLGLTVVGDFAQLPPVEAPFAFEAKCWDEIYGKNTLLLTQIRRQADAEFIEALRKTRRGEGAAALEYFRQFMHDRDDADFSGSTIVALNQTVDTINRQRHDAIPGEPELWKSKREGLPRGEWKQIPDALSLKPGALVMVLANARIPLSKDFLYVNGDLGTYVGRDQQEDPWDPGSMIDVAMVELQRTGQTVGVAQVIRSHYMRKNDPKAVPLYPRETTEEELTKTQDENGEQQEKDNNAVLVGYVEYLPLRLAYASTVHKSQGLSLDRVQINIKDTFFGNPGSLYVALSRARTPAGLRLVGSPALFVARCRADERVRRFL